MNRFLRLSLLLILSCAISHRAVAMDFSHKGENTAEGRFKDAHQAFYQSEYEKAINLYEEQLKDCKNTVDDQELIKAKVNCAEAYFACGDFKNGSELFEARLNSHGRKKLKKPLTADNVKGLKKGDTLVVRWEHGIGDTACFIRALKPFHDKGIRTVLVERGFLKDLFDPTSHEYIEEFKTDKDEISEDSYTYEAYLMSLPWLISQVNKEHKFEASTPQTFVNIGQYIFAPKQATQRWSQELAKDPKVPVIAWWRASDNLAGEYRKLERKIPLREMLSVLRLIDGIRVYTLSDFDNAATEEGEEKTGKVDNFDMVPTGMLKDVVRVKDKKFADVAGLMQAVKDSGGCMVSTDTVMPNLAAAMGVDVGVYLPYYSDWRWGKNNTEESWLHPTATLFWQKNNGEWSEPLQESKKWLEQKRDAWKSSRNK